ncbi:MULTISPECIES: hypothetical protein [Klebsiella]|uniref:Uncharacterized protein n=1 Tax=Klebsiella electrica TaxID=1259973 RepID=A0AAJ5UGX6_9ENTR|nr:hypothetical protein [Klebsiella electrica]QDI08580.1 hypothetical protein electrica_02460 [Klebsiella electrica]WBW63698.1 hypothetical protein OR613_12795 [Klebsiella electrica]WIO40915.1 hypothetical protein P2G42_13120 [Klebsiella electrica]BBV76462.1 hypothetical protein STW0522RAO56_25160 [Raoultella planticola]
MPPPVMTKTGEGPNNMTGFNTFIYSRNGFIAAAEGESEFRQRLS